MSAIQYAVNLATAPAISDPHIVWAFAGPSIVGFVSAIVFWFVYKDLDKEEYVISNNDYDDTDAAESSRVSSEEFGASKSTEAADEKGVRHRGTTEV